MPDDVAPVLTGNATGMAGWRDYLRAPVACGPVSTLLLLAGLYTSAGNAALSLSFLLLCGLGISMLFRAARWRCHALTMLLLVVHTHAYVFQIAGGSHDNDSDRDEAAQIAAETFLEARNPWSVRSPTGNPITTGPASVLIAAPLVAMFGDLSVVTFIMYVSLFGFLAYGDLTHRNESFIPLSLLVVTGVLGFQHTMFWSLDELYYGMPLLAAAWLLLRRGWLGYSGACLALAVLVRASYAFPVAGFLAWWATTARVTGRDVRRIATGTVLGLAVGLTPFLVTDGWQFVADNPFTVASSYLGSPWPETNPVFQSLNALIQWTGVPGPAKAAIGILAVVIVAVALRDRPQPHPFWHVAAGGLAASLLVLWPEWLNDYSLMFVWPSVMAVAWSPSGQPQAAGAREG